MSDYRTRTRVLVISESGSDAALVRQLMHSGYPATKGSTDPEQFAADFDRLRPQVLVLAFRSIDVAQRHYLGLYRRSSLVAALPHRTVLLCDKENLHRAYEACLSDHFDDYVLFWPLVHDATRLAMSVRLALQVLAGEQSAVPLAQFAAQARRIADLESQLEKQLAQGRARIEQVSSQVEQARSRISAAVDGMSNRLLDTGFDAAVVVQDRARAQQELARLNDEAVLPTLRLAAQSVQPMRHWIDALTTELARPLQAARAIADHARRLRPLLLVVDDDEFQRELLSHVLASANYDVDAVGSAAAAQRWLRGHRPDLILMDVGLPDISGIELTRRLKSNEAHAGIPVIMLTARSERQVIVDSLDSGAADFVVKPIEREILMRKLTRWLNG